MQHPLKASIWTVMCQIQGTRRPLFCSVSLISSIQVNGMVETRSCHPLKLLFWPAGIALIGQLMVSNDDPQLDLGDQGSRCD